MTAPLLLERPPGWVRYTPLWLLPLPALWFAYVLSFNPTDNVMDPTGPCAWHTLFGIDGPSCGITRMTWYLLHGNLVDAARMHLAALLLIPFGAYAFLWWVAGWVFGRRLPMFSRHQTSCHRLRRRLPSLLGGAAQSALAPVRLVLRRRPDVGAAAPVKAERRKRP